MVDHYFSETIQAKCEVLNIEIASIIRLDTGKDLIE